MFKSPFESYAYSYPHKTAYRGLQPRVPLADLWRRENVESLFLYLHIPFCEYRCGFCNLFTLSRPAEELPGAYLATLRRQARQIREAIPGARFSRLAIGGGTPTFLDLEQLGQLKSIVRDELGVDALQIPSGCEASPSTVDPEKLAMLRQWGIDRISLGIQSFDDREVHAIGRPQKSEDVHRAIRLVQEAGFPTLNLDLIYGGDNQSTASWLDSVRRAIDYAPQEIYLYPLYVRALTGLDRVGSWEDLTVEQQQAWDASRLDAYRAARTLLCDQGYEQTSLRMFRLADSNTPSCPEYHCQEDGMVGLGCGARSYTERLHYSYEYAVGTKAVRGIIDDFIQRDDDSFRHAEFGFELDEEDRRRRHIIMSLLQCQGLSRAQYTSRFGDDAMTHFPALSQLVTSGYLIESSDRLRLTDTGIEYSDAIGPWLASQKVRQLSESYQCR